jgi:hypothetical protein
MCGKLIYIGNSAFGDYRSGDNRSGVLCVESSFILVIFGDYRSRVFCVESSFIQVKMW